MKNIYICLILLLLAFAGKAQMMSVPYDSDSTYYRVDIGIKHAERCKYLFLEYDSLKTLPDNIAVLSQLKGITFRYCVNANWAQVFKTLSQLPNLEFVEISVNKLSKLNDNIALLKHLKSLSLKTNNLTSLPNGIKELRSLQYLDLSFNPDLRWDEVLEKLADCPQLEALNISSCSLTSVSDKISDLTHLKKLWLNNNGFESLPPAFKNLQLEYLNLGSCLQLNWKKVMPDVAVIQTLKEFVVSDNELTVLHEKIVTLKHLEKLDASGNELTALPENIGELTELKELNVGTGKTMTTHDEIAKFPSSFSKLINLEVLNLNGTYLQDLPPGIDKMTKLRELLINWCGLASLKGVENCTQLKILRASHNYFDKLPDQIGNLTQLKVLELDGNFFPAKQVPHLILLPSSITNLSELEVLSLNDQLLRKLPKDFGKLGKLRILNLRNNQLESLPESVAQCTALEELDLKANDLTTFPDFSPFTSLKKLDVSFNDLIDLDKEAGKFSKLPALKHLDISYLKASNNTIVAIETSLPNTEIIYKAFKDLKFNPDKK